MERRCSRCQATKHEDDFAGPYNSKARKDIYCRPCRAAYGREHYLKNRQRYIDNAKKNQRIQIEERMAFLQSFLETHPCVDCGERDVVVLEFDHLGDKCFDISNGLRYRKWETVLAEMEKCEVVCANCHRRRTMRRGRHRRLKWLMSDPQRRLF
jgi:hypothetical protein